MFVDDVVLRAAAPPAVRVPTLEPSTSSFATTRMLRSNVQHQRKQQQQQQPHRSTLRDHYQARQLGLAQQNPHHADPLEEMENTTNDVHIEELIRGIKETSAAATAAIEEITGGSPPPRPVTPSLQQTPPEQLHFRSASPERTNYVRSSSATRPRRDGSPARPAWNQNRPTPRVRPTVSAPRTEPRRVTREASADSRSRPWLEGVQRTNSLKGQLSGDNGVKTNSGARGLKACSAQTV
ncbi:hypothetical protein DQ04_03751000 [Trypanosoma grayi]|uniref:hypothetical protein n=1 Tax=Trypanosoma grayi TaxID=71804 RepID=UPI0004F3F4DA|nr:hypothetical protein DQ04_03751000 [Trypanosoma grayi]KEG10397.1 hypothetical protein DQ04_03751000 [Trypanosoma grayi]